MVLGTGLHAPGRAIPNAEYNARYGLDVDAFLVANRNIRTRHLMAASEATSDLAVPAAREALAAAGVPETDVDLIIVATDTPDYISPPTSAVVQYKLGARHAAAFDVNATCAGFVTAIDMASKYIAADEKYKHILVIGASGMSKFVDWDDYKIATLFADGAGAVLMGPSPSRSVGVRSTTLYAEGGYHDYMGIYAGGTFMPTTTDAIDRKDHLLRFAKKFPPETNQTHWPRLIGTVLHDIGLKPNDVAHYFFTQINITSINRTLEILDVPATRAHNIMDCYAYTGSACIGMSIADAARKHLLKRGDLIVLVGSGGGMVMAALTMIWGYDT